MAPAKEDLVMEHLVSLHYAEPLTPNLERFADAILDGRLLGQRCPSCGRVYLPGKGYCSLCVVPTGEKDDVEVADQGTVTGFTIIAPVAYYGQTETEPFVYASIKLDGVDSNLTGQDIVGIPHEDIRMGLRVRARWVAPEARSVEGLSSRGWGGITGVIESFEPTGEPDADLDTYKEYIF